MTAYVYNRMSMSLRVVISSATNQRIQTTYDDLPKFQDEPGMLKSRDYFNSLIEAEAEKGIPSSRVVIGSLHLTLSIDLKVTNPDRWILPRSYDVSLDRNS